MQNLSIVMQGPIGEAGELSPAVWKYILRTRKTFPAAELIVSSWKVNPDRDAQLHARLAGHGIVLILSDDPGPLIGYDRGGKYVTNVNRQLLSSQAGLAVATRPLAIKMRVDCYLYSRRLAALLVNRVTSLDGLERDERYAVFQSRVINLNLYARDARGSIPILFHPGDILLAGKTVDVRAFFAAPQASHDDLFLPSTTSGIWSAWRYVAEQYYWVHAIARATGRRVFEGNIAHGAALRDSSERYYLANFIPYSPGQVGLRWPKYWRSYPLRGLFSVYTLRRWVRLYHRLNGQKTALTLIVVLDSLGTLIWRTGYRLRTTLVRIPSVRKVLLALFSHRK
ncbi:WavE lipopolysaccharide synthesis family protein [Dryocola sp. BD626]|uniref:WavE lipopolysaccharide synthesis family protein n=1 Tax=Dryocola sp. BD626 TaxID=3133273 RepID=UPI003F5024C7